MYILANKKTKKVIEILNQKPVSFSSNLTLLKVDKIPDKFDYLTVQNAREITDYYTVEEIVDDKPITVEKSKTYLTCDLVANFNKERVLTSEQKEKLRSEKIVKLIRKKYSVDEELAILRQKDSKPNKFKEYFNYATECVNKVPKD